MDMLLEVPPLNECLPARETVRKVCTPKEQLEHSPLDLPTLARTLELSHAQMIRAYVASHVVPPADDLQTPTALPPLLFRYETLIAVSRPSTRWYQPIKSRSKVVLSTASLATSTFSWSHHHNASQHGSCANGTSRERRNCLTSSHGSGASGLGPLGL